MRLKPYTAIGVRRLSCVRGCGRRGSASWRICADGKQYRPLCAECDVALNEMVMRWAFGYTREADLDAYRKERLG